MSDKPTEYWLAQQLGLALTTEYAWVPETRQGYTWRGGRWAADRAGGWLTDRVAAWLRESGMRAEAKRVDAVISLVRRQAALLAPVDQWDARPGLLQTPAGVVELRTGQLRPAVPGDYCLHCTAVEPTTGADGSPWLAHLQWMMEGDAVRASYLLLYLGYAITGCRRNQSLLVLHGNGNNGKSVLMDSVAAVLGDYAGVVPRGVLASRDGEVRDDALAHLQGRRLMIADESAEGHRLNEDVIKALTGSARISARHLHCKYYDYAATAVYVMMTNHRPLCRGTDDGIWRRLRLLPCLARADPPDEGLLERLISESGGGILALLISAAAMYYRQGLPACPRPMLEAAREYRADTDVIGAFLAEQTQPGGRIGARALYAAYDRWMDQQGERPGTARSLRAELRQRGWEQRETNQGTMWIGMQLRTHEEDDNGEILAGGDG